MYISFDTTGKTYCYYDTNWSTVSTGAAHICPDCDKPRWQLWPPTTAGVTIIKRLCECSKLEKPKQYGWVCPVCGKGKSPYSTECKH
jgi:hypothetical protein